MSHTKKRVRFVCKEGEGEGAGAIESSRTLTTLNLAETTDSNARQITELPGDRSRFWVGSLWQSKHCVADAQQHRKGMVYHGSMILSDRGR